MLLRTRVALLVLACLVPAACSAARPPVTQPMAPADVQDLAEPEAVGTAGLKAEEVQAADTGSITGRVLTTTDPAGPIVRARVILSGEAVPESRIAITGEDGTFTFDKLPGGSYTVTASASGFAPQAYGQRRGGPAAAIALTSGQRLTAIDIPLAAAGVIVGQVLDEDGKPFVGAVVEALIPRTQDNQTSLVSMSDARTDDRGMFRLAGLPEGQYYVTAFDPAFENVGDHTGPLRYTPTYYPGVASITDATRVGVTPGEEPSSKIVVKLRILRPATLTGVLATPDESLLMSGFVIMSPVRGEALASVPSDDVEILPDGSFTFRNVAPGEYQIRARAQTDTFKVALFATYRISVDGRDIGNIHMPLRPGATMSGTVTYLAQQTPRPLAFTGIRVRAPFWDGSSFGDSLTGDVAPDGSFDIRGVMSGTHYVTVEGLAHPWVIRNISWRGRDITDLPLDVESRQTVDGLRVTLTDLASEVTGTVRDAKGRAVTDALVMALPVSAQFWTRSSRRFGVTRTDDTGRYRLRGLPAGDYRLVASVDLDESELNRREILAQYSAEGLPLGLGDRDTRTLDLALATVRRTTTR